MKTSATNRKLRLLLTGIRNETLIPNADFQRRLVWSNKHKVAFLETVLDGLPFPEIFTAAGSVNTDTGEGVELIVDGQQRVTTLYQYFTGSKDLRLGSTIPPYAALSVDQKTAFLEYDVVIRDLGPLTPRQTRELFYRINSTAYSLNAMEVNNARYDGMLKHFCDELSEAPFFTDRRIFSAYDVKRMNDVRWILTLIITMMSTYFNRDSEHEAYLSRFNDELPAQDELRARFDETAARVASLDQPERSRAWQKSDLLTLMVEVDRLRDTWEDKELDATSQALTEFYRKVDAVAAGDPDERDPRAHEYQAASRSGTNDRSSRLRRAAIIREILKSQAATGEATEQMPSPESAR